MTTMTDTMKAKIEQVKKEELAKMAKAEKKADMSALKTIVGDDMGRAKMIALSLIDAHPLQPADRKPDAAMVESVRLYGVLQPVIVTEADGRYTMQDGEMRRQSALVVGLESIPCIVRKVSVAHLAANVRVRATKADCFAAYLARPADEPEIITAMTLHGMYCDAFPLAKGKEATTPQDIKAARHSLHVRWRSVRLAGEAEISRLMETYKTGKRGTYNKVKTETAPATHEDGTATVATEMPRGVVTYADIARTAATLADQFPEVASRAAAVAALLGRTSVDVRELVSAFTAC